MRKLIKAEDKIFVAGAGGMVGSAVCRALKRKGYGDISLGGSLLTPTRQELNLLNANEVTAWFAAHKPDIVVLGAAKVGGIFANKTYPADFLLENLKIQTNVIETAWKNGVRRFLFLGSSCIYPKCSNQPIKEESLLTGSLELTNEWYAIAKISGIKLCQGLRQQHGFDAISLMPTNLYGPGDNYHSTNSHVLPAFIRRFHEASETKAQSVTCWGSGRPLREFLHADDCGEACVFALENWDPGPDELPFINVGTGVEISIAELAALVSEVIGFNGTINWDTREPDGTPKKLLDVSRLASLGWRSSISLSEGLISTISIYSEQLRQSLIRM